MPKSRLGNNNEPVPTAKEFGDEVIRSAASGLDKSLELRFAREYYQACRINRTRPNYEEELGAYALRELLSRDEPVIATMFGVPVVISPIPGTEPANPGNDPQGPTNGGDREPRKPVTPSAPAQAYSIPPTG